MARRVAGARSPDDLGEAEIIVGEPFERRAQLSFVGNLGLAARGLLRGEAGVAGFVAEDAVDAAGQRKRAVRAAFAIPVVRLGRRAFQLHVGEKSHGGRGSSGEAEAERVPGRAVRAVRADDVTGPPGVAGFRDDGDALLVLRQAA